MFHQCVLVALLWVLMLLGLYDGVDTIARMAPVFGLSATTAQSQITYFEFRSDNELLPTVLAGDLNTLDPGSEAMARFLDADSSPAWPNEGCRMLDSKIVGGVVVDGTGAAPFFATHWYAPAGLFVSSNSFLNNESKKLLLHFVGVVVHVTSGPPPIV